MKKNTWIHFPLSCTLSILLIYPPLQTKQIQLHRLEQVNCLINSPQQSYVLCLEPTRRPASLIKRFVLNKILSIQFSMGCFPGDMHKPTKWWHSNCFDVRCFYKYVQQIPLKFGYCINNFKCRPEKNCVIETINLIKTTRPLKSYYFRSFILMLH